MNPFQIKEKAKKIFKRRFKKFMGGVKLSGPAILTAFFIWAIPTPFSKDAPHPFPPDYPIFGIDVSHFQGKINWSRVETSGITFAFIKASEGYTHRDPRFASNWKALDSATILRGAYHYFSLCRRGKKQAENFIEASSLGPGDLRPVVDVEYTGNCKNLPERNTLMSELKAYLKAIEESFGVPAIIYTSVDFYRDYFEVEALPNPFWIRHLESSPPPLKSWVFWQFALGPISGISGKVDLNVFNGNRDKIDSLRVPP